MFCHERRVRLSVAYCVFLDSVSWSSAKIRLFKQGIYCAFGTQKKLPGKSSNGQPVE